MVRLVKYAQRLETLAAWLSDSLNPHYHSLCIVTIRKDTLDIIDFENTYEYAGGFEHCQHWAASGTWRMEDENFMLNTDINVSNLLNESFRKDSDSIKLIQMLRN